MNGFERITNDMRNELRQQFPNELDGKEITVFEVGCSRWTNSYSVIQMYLASTIGVDLRGSVAEKFSEDMSRSGIVPFSGWEVTRSPVCNVNGTVTVSAKSQNNVDDDDDDDDSTQLVFTKTITSITEFTLDDFVFRFKEKNGFRSIFVAKCSLYNIARDSEEKNIYIAYHAGDVDLFDKFINDTANLCELYEKITKEEANNRYPSCIEVVNGRDIQLKTIQRWEDVLIDETGNKNIREDFKFFLGNRDWYSRHNIPYKRSYLLHGPPGNGKTCIVRAMSFTRGIVPVSFDFSNRNSGNGDFQRMFDKARNGISLLILEEIDRVFAGSGHHSNVTKDCLLNCLDGVSGLDNAIIIATTNHPERLDAAIRRPGRFDFICEIETPNRDMRCRYLKKLYSYHDKNAVTDEHIEGIADATELFSMAYLKELYIQSARICLSDHRAAIENQDVTAACGVVVEQFRVDRIMDGGKESKPATPKRVRVRKPSVKKS